MKRKEKPTGGGRPETHLRKQVVLSRIFKRMVPVDYSYQSKKKYRGLKSNIVLTNKGKNIKIMQLQSRHFYLVLSLSGELVQLAQIMFL